MSLFKSLAKRAPDVDFVEYVLPEFWVGPLLYDDYSGLEDDEVRAVLHFLDDVRAEHGISVCVAVADQDSAGDVGFITHHDARPYGILACNCLIFTFESMPELIKREVLA